YDDAYELVREDFDRECRDRGSADLRLLGDVARLSGHTGQARLAYIALRDRFAATPEAADAAFALGRLALEKEGDRVAAQRWFETHLRERPQGPLAAAALGRLMELEGGDPDRATLLAREYLKKYPNGPHAASAHKVLDADR